jgi:NitT/TauT family transport system ATP-binding protein
MEREQRLSDLSESSWALQAEGLFKAWPGKGRPEPVLEDVTLRIGAGEFVSILGPSGCGKSTLLHLLGGFEPTDQGTVRIGNRTIDRPTRQVVMLFQDYGLLPWRSVQSNVELGLEPMGLAAAERKERAGFYLSLVQLADKRDLFPHQLSGGMKQRVALARALAVRPAFLLMDEPFAALDTFTRYYLQDELLRIQAQEGVTVVLVTHDIDEAVYLSDRVFVMNGKPGRLQREIRIPAAKPRDRGHGEFQLYRKQILEQFRLTGFGTNEEFTI